MATARFADYMVQDMRTHGMPLRLSFPPYPVVGMPNEVLKEYIEGEDPITGVPLMQEIIDGLRLGGLLLRSVSLPGNPSCLNRHAYQKGNYKESYRSGRSNANQMTTDEFRCPVDRTRRAIQYGFVGQVSLYVRRQIRRRAVAPRAVFLESLHRDPIKITTEFPL